MALTKVTSDVLDVSGVSVALAVDTTVGGVKAYVDSGLATKQTTLTYTPVQQGTGVGQTANVVKIGWSAGSRLKATVDATDLGNLVTDAQLGAYAPLASPALSGVPTAPTAGVGTNTTQLATTAFVIANAGGGSYVSYDQGYNAVGSFCFCIINIAIGLSAGSTIAGSNLNPAGISASLSTGAASVSSGPPTLSVTWRTLGAVTASSGYGAATLFQRIA